MKKIKLGLLPLYIQLYDDTSPELRPEVEAFYEAAADLLRGLDIDVITPPVCRIEKEFRDAIKAFREEGAVGIITLHLAYSPSLEAIDSICESRLPILSLDVTRAYSFGPGQSIDEINYNHGIHGSQDLCCMLNRRNIPYEIIAGHISSKRVADSVVSWAKAAQCTASLKNARVGIIGAPFNGMGDFQAPYEVLSEKLGFSVVEYNCAAGRMALSELSETDISEEVSLLKGIYDCSAVDHENLVRTAKTNLVIREWRNRENLNAFTVNFLDAQKGAGLEMMPFTAASIAMSHGIGYAGEGDVLTAALVYALASIYKKTSFTEMFCPDWEGGSIYLSHMGEINTALVAGEPRLLQKPFIYTDIGDSVSPCGLFTPGEAAIVNLAPTANDGFRLIVCMGRVLEVIGVDNMADCPHGWFKPDSNLDVFLEKYGKSGGTHHSALVYGVTVDEMGYFGNMAGFDTVFI